MNAKSQPTIDLGGVEIEVKIIRKVRQMFRDAPPELHPEDCRCLRCISLRV